ncbi:MAG: metallophosphoesterase [Candidatus Hydrothermarchaeales archaeon]
MKLFCIADIHGDFGEIDKIRDRARDHDLIIIAGDLTNFNSRKVAMHMIEDIQEINDVLIVPGNCDLPETLMVFEELGISLHGEGKVVGDVGFFGVGGSNFTPFDTPFEIGEDEISRLLCEGYRKIAGCKRKILVSHPPPHGTRVDKTASGMHAGSRAVWDFIQRFDVDIVLCGHIHEARGEDRSKDTIILNLAPCHKGFVSLEIGEGIDFEFVDF